MCGKAEGSQLLQTEGGLGESSQRPFYHHLPNPVWPIPRQVAPTAGLVTGCWPGQTLEWGSGIESENLLSRIVSFFFFFIKVS